MLCFTGMNHFTNKDGYNAIRSQPSWLFLARKPPGRHPTGAYFSTLDASESRLAQRLRIPQAKLKFVFAFSGDEGLERIPGGRGEYIRFSRQEYTVAKDRQLTSGATGIGS